MQYCAIKHGVCFSLSVNSSVGLAELAESSRNVWKQQSGDFQGGYFHCLSQSAISPRWRVKPLRHQKTSRLAYTHLSLPTVDVPRIPSRDQGLIMLLDKHTKRDNSHPQRTCYLMTQKQLMRPEA